MEESALDLRGRLTKGLLDFSTSIPCGALVQMWMPDQLSDGSTVLSAQGLPFALSGVGDLLALFRCVSVRYRFATDFNKPALMGAPGRVYASSEPEMTGDVQKYSKQAYLRVTEAQRCKVHSVFVVPVFDKRAPGKPLAVFELVQGERDIAFPAIMAGLRRSLEGVFLSTTDVELRALNASLRGMPMPPPLEGPSRRQQQPLQQQSQQGGGGGQQSTCQILEVKTVEAPSSSMAAAASEHRSRGPNTERMPCSGVSFERLSDEGNSSRASDHISPNDASVHGPRNSSMHGVRGSDCSVHSGGGGSSDQYGSGSTAPTPAAPAADRLEGSMHGGACQEHHAFSGAPPAQQPSLQVGTPLPPQPPQRLQLQPLLPPPASAAPEQPHQQLLLGGPAPSGAGPVYATSSATARDPQGGGSEAKGPQGRPSKAVLSRDAQALQLLSWMNQNGLGQDVVIKAIAMHTKGNARGSSAVARATAKPAASAPTASQRTYALQQQRQQEEEDEIGASSEDDDNNEKAGKGRDNNRSTGGAGKRLRFEDLQAQFGLGLKEAASNLGICATTLKRACWQHSVRLWPRRQIAKLNKTLMQLSQQGSLLMPLVNRSSVVDMDGDFNLSEEALEAAVKQEVLNKGHAPSSQPVAHNTNHHGLQGQGNVGKEQNQGDAVGKG